MKRAIFGVWVAAAALAAFPASNVSAAPGTAQVAVGFSIDTFVKQGSRLVAHGRAVATYTAPDGSVQSTTQPFTAHVVTHGIRGLAAASTTCPVLYLELDKLALTLLGLNVNLDKVILTIDADSSGGALGSLFCKLAHTKVSLSSLTAARRLTAVTRASGLANPLSSGLGFAVPVSTGATSASGTCPVLDLVLGPLNLKLLGLIVNLNQVHLTITADSTGGVLGSLFCSLAGATATVPSSG